MSNELQRVEVLINHVHKRVYFAKQGKSTNAMVPILILEELIDIINDSIRTIKEYNAQPFDHTLPVPPKGLTDDRSTRRIPEKERT